jgi:hypothetical protein
MKNIFNKVIALVIRYRILIVFIFLPLLSAYMHHKIFKLDLQGAHAWRQTETQTVINNFVEKDMNILNPRVNNHGNENDIYRLEFPLMQWTYALFYKAIGNYIIISRILTFITGLFCVFGFYFLSYQLTKDYLSAIIGTWIFNFSPSFYYYTMNPMPDTMALCFSVWGLLFFIKWIQGKSNLHLIVCLFFFSLSTLIKLPFIVNFALIGGYQIVLLIHNRLKQVRELSKVLVLSALFLLPALAWYLWVIPTWEKSQTITGILGLKKNQLPGLTGILIYHLKETFPYYLANLFALPFFILGLIFIFIKRPFKSILFITIGFWLLALLLYYSFEINTIGLWHDYYFFPFLPLIFIIMVYGINNIIKNRQIIPVVLVGLLCAYIPVEASKYAGWRWPVVSSEMNPDYIICKNALRKAVPDTALVVVANDITPCIDLYYIHKKGWVVDNFWLPEDTLIKRIDNGARYFYCDTRKIDDYEKITPHLKRKILECNTIRVWELKK